jgi:4-oxalocrotonate tautomerase
MPIARIAIMEGRSEHEIASLIDAVTEAIHASLGAPHRNIRVLIEVVPLTQWGIGGKTAAELGET